MNVLLKPRIWDLIACRRNASLWRAEVPSAALIEKRAGAAKALKMVTGPA
jgi:hypothetical protein